MLKHLKHENRFFSLFADDGYTSTRLSGQLVTDIENALAGMMPWVEGPAGHVPESTLWLDVNIQNMPSLPHV